MIGAVGHIRDARLLMESSSASDILFQKFACVETARFLKAALRHLKTEFDGRWCMVVVPL